MNAPRTTQNDRSFDPDSPPPRVAPGGARINLLHVPPALLALTALWTGPTGLALGLGGAMIWLGAAQLTRQGLIAEQAFHARSHARRPAWPRKITGSLLTGLGMALAALAHDGSATGAALYGVIACALHLVAFGPDPLRDRLPEGTTAHDSDRVTRAVERAAEELTGLRAAIAALRDPDLDAEVAAFERSARRLIARIEEDPRSLSGARRYLGIYLTGAREASEKFAEVYARSPDPEIRAEFTELLDDLRRNFAARTEKMLQEEAMDMTIEIDVLRERLRREGALAGTEEAE